MTSSSSTPVAASRQFPIFDNVFSGVASRVVFLPLVTRELRAQARRPKMYYGRMFIVAVWIVVAAYGWLIASTLPPFVSKGQPLFTFISGALFGWAVFSAWAACDSISVEKREGTIGFLFLTDLKSHDIVLGKMVASALPAFYTALGALPLMAVCLAVGGITPLQYVKTALAILNTFFLCQGIGIFSSALCRLRGNAAGLPLLLLLLYEAGLGITQSVATFKGWSRLAYFCQLNSPTHAYFLALAQTISPRAASNYWLSLLVVHLHAWLFFGLAVWALPRRWRDNPRRANPWKQIWERWRYGSIDSRAAFRQRWVGVNPFSWLLCRRQLSPVYGWGIMGLIVGLAMLLAASFIMDDGWNSAYAGCFIGCIVLLQLLLRAATATQAALLEEHRRNGSLETILCCSPMSVDEILNGMWLMMSRYLFWPTVAVLAIETLMFLGAVVTGLKGAMNWDLLGFIMVSGVLLAPDIKAMAWMAMWSAMTNPKPRSAGSSAFFWVCVLPWLLVGMFAIRLRNHEHWVWLLWLTLALANDAVVIRLAQKRLHQNFRLWAVPSYGEALSLLGRLGRLLGFLWRRLHTPHAI